MTSSLPQHPLAEGHPAVLPAHIPFGVFLWEWPGQHSHAGRARRHKNARAPHPAPAPLPGAAGHAVLHCEDTDSCRHELTRIFLKMFLVWDFWSVSVSRGSTYPRHNGASPADASCQAGHLLCWAAASTHFFAHLGNKVLDKITYYAL